jgi:hypothetical protein
MRALVMLAVISGCSFGVGSSYVGQWNPRKQVEFEACLVEDAPDANAPAKSATCKDKKQVVKEVPGRKYWGVILPILQLGGARVDFAGKQETVFRIQPAIEYMQGRGRWALGVRTGVLVDSAAQEADGTARVASAMTVALIGHVSIFDQMSLYGGVGYLPYGGTQGERTSVGVQGLGGFQYALNKTHSETFIVFSFEVDQTYLQLDTTYRSMGFTGHFGIFF